MTDTARIFDVVIVGNGALGLSLAYALKKQDRALKVVVVGPQARPGAATMTAGAMINVWAEMAPGQFDNPALADRAELTISAMGLWDGLCAELSEFAESPLKIQWGTYIINNALGSPHEVRTVDYILKTMRERNVPHEVLGPSAVPWLNPEPRGQITRVVRVPDGRIDSRLVLKAYERALRALDVTLIDGYAETLVANGATRSVTLRDGTVLQGGQIVLANGSFAQALVDQVPELRRGVPRLVWGAGSGLDVSFPAWIHRYGGLDRSIFDADAVVRTVDRGGACGAHLVPYGNGEYYFGASSGVWFDPEDKPRVHALHVLLRSLVEEFSKAFFYATISVRGPGFRPTAVDTFPLLGESHISGIWYANGTKRDGFTCSAFIAPEMARAMLGQANQLPKRFTPSRKLISYKNREAALDDSVTANFGGEIQHGLILPPYAPDNYRAAMRKTYETIYDRRGITDFGIHPEVTHLYENDEFFAACEHPRESVL